MAAELTARFYSIEKQLKLIGSAFFFFFFVNAMCVNH